MLPLAAALAAAAAACELDRSPTAAAPDSLRDGAPSADFIAATGTAAALPGLSAREQALFARGSAVFQTVFTPATGLGPLFNGVGCAACHQSPAPGGVGTQIETHATSFVGGVCEGHQDVNGGSVVQSDATPLLRADGITQERLPGDLAGLAVGHRTTPDLFGFGLLEAVPERQILARADPDDRDGDGISGRPNRTADGELGRFGRKAQIPTLSDFVTDAFIYEQGITSPDEPEEQTNFGVALPGGVDPAPDPEVTREDVDAATAFVRFLAPPRHQALGPATLQGSFTFARIGCAACHVPALYTGYHREPALSRKVVYAYTDLLLHDMGPALADICVGQALPSEFRTEPLMGLRFAQRFLHDGRAATLDDAILLHGGEAARARDRYKALSPYARSSLRKFLSSL